MSKRTHHHKKLVTVISDSPFFEDKVHGGLQRKVRPILESLAEKYKVELFCGVGSNLQINSCEVHLAFDNNCKLFKELEEPLEASIRQSDLLVSIETPLKSDNRCQSVLILGGMGYDWSREVAESHDWSVIVVPSEHAQSQLGALKIKSKVIVNGYNWDLTAPIKSTSPLPKITSPTTKILISPHRLGKEKGHFEAVVLTSKLLAQGVDCSLLVPKQDFFMTPPGFYRELARFADKTLPEDRFIFHNWIKNDDIVAYYAAADLTLALGTVQEGFGAFALESIAAMTPVLSTRRGAIPDLVPEGHGLYLVDHGQWDNAANQAAEILCMDDIDRQQLLTRGRDFVTKHYRESRMVKEYMSLFAENLTPASLPTYELV